jgi:hypothetical protein
MPGRVGLGAALPQIRSKMVHPAPNGLIGQSDPAFRQQIFDVAEAQGEPEIERDCPMNDLKREPVTAVADFLHCLGDWTARATASSEPL